MRYLLSVLLIFSFAFAQTAKVITIQEDDVAKVEKKIEVKKEIKDGKVLVSITENGKTEVHEFDIDDEEAMAKIHAKLDTDGEEGCSKVKIVKKIKEHNCKKENCDPATCKHAKKKECKKDEMVWQSKDDDKKVKIIKKYKSDNDLLLTDEKTGFLGVQIQDLSGQLAEHFKVKDAEGVLVSEVVEGSPADKAGLEAGDIIVKVDDKEIESASNLTAVIRSYEPKSKVKIKVVRDGKKKSFDATLDEAENRFPQKFGFPGSEERHMMMSKMHSGQDKFDFFSFPSENLKEEMEVLKKEMEELKAELKKLKESK